MKSVLLSIQPKWCEKIAIGEKTVEIRKTRPKLDVPFKVYIYCTNTRPYLVWGDVFRGNWETEFTHLSGYNRKEAERIWDVFNGKVMGEFVCNNLTYIEAGYDTNGDKHLYNTAFIEQRMCITYNELHEYLYKSRENCGGWAWHISNLVIYDAPKELGEYIIQSKIGCCNEGKCRGCKWFDKGNGFNLEDDCNAKFDTDEYKPITRPPQSWCYVEELK